MIQPLAGSDLFVFTKRLPKPRLIARALLHEDQSAKILLLSA